MNDQKPAAWTPYIVCGICAAPCVTQLIVESFVERNPDTSFLISSGLGSAAAAVVILSIVRRLNRRDDSRHAKRPPDAT